MPNLADILATDRALRELKGLRGVRCGKVRYGTQSFAIKKGRQFGQMAYECRRCGFYHLTSG